MYYKKKITYIPALYRLFDEGLVNAIDQVVRLQVMNKDFPDMPIKHVKNIKVTIDSNKVSIYKKIGSLYLK